MDLNKLMIDYLAEEGFRPHETPFGIAFKIEGINYLYFNDLEDEQYFRLMMPAIFEVVKLYTMDMQDEEGKEKETSVWVAFEILADSTPELADIVPRAISLLKGARLAFLSRLEEVADH